MGVGEWFHTGGRERKEETDPVCAVTKPASLGSICLDKVSVPKLPAGFKESIQPPALPPTLRWGDGSVCCRVACFGRCAGYSVSFQRAVGKDCSSPFPISTSWSLEIFRGLSVSLLCAICILRKLTALLSVGKAWKYSSEGFKISIQNHKWRNQIQTSACFYPMFPWNQTPCDHDPLASPSRCGRDDIIRNNFFWQRKRVTGNWKQWFLVDEPARQNIPASVSQTSEWTVSFPKGSCNYPDTRFASVGRHSFTPLEDLAHFL